MNAINVSGSKHEIIEFGSINHTYTKIFFFFVMLYDRRVVIARDLITNYSKSHDKFTSNLRVPMIFYRANEL